MTILVFLTTGKALTFHDVTIEVDDVNLFIFTYTSRGSQKKMQAKFLQSNLVGYSKEIE